MNQKRVFTARRILIVVGMIVLLCPMVVCGTIMGAIYLSEPLARSMTPPTYPNSLLLGRDHTSGTWGFTETAFYSTSDSFAVVDQWFTRNASKLKRSLLSNGSIKYADPAIDGLFPYIVGYLNKAQWGTGPSASLTIYPDSKNPKLTLITVFVAWPNP